MINKWSLYQDSEIWKYCFKKEHLENNNRTYRDLLRQFIMACYTSNLSKIIKKNNVSEQEYEMTVEDYLNFLEGLKKENGKDIYPKVSSGSVYNYGKETFYDYSFDNSVYFYDAIGNISHQDIRGKELSVFLEKINHGQKNYKGLSLPFEFETYYRMGANREIMSFDFVIHFNSDIWLSKVPCSHCSQNVSNETLRREGGLSQIEKYWHDNIVLSELNRAKINLFMGKMNLLTKEYTGEVLIDKEDLRLYKQHFNERGFIEMTKPIA